MEKKIEKAGQPPPRNFSGVSLRSKGFAGNKAKFKT